MEKRGRKPSRYWAPILTDAQTRGLTVGELAREQGVPYSTTIAASRRLEIPLRVDGRKKRWDGLRTRDRVQKANNSNTFPEYALGDLTQNERLAPALAIAAPRTWVEPNAIYVLAEFGGGHCKIGITAGNDIYRRIRELRLGNPRELSIAHWVEVENPRRIERAAHSKLWTKRVRGEWFAVTAAEAVEAVREAIAEECSRADTPSPLT
jgi:hypothetical protein